MDNNNRKELKFLYDDDLLSVFEKLGVKDDFLNKRLKCSICETVITMDNFHSIHYDNGIKIGCSEKNCMESIEKNYGYR